jgi:NAD(P)H-nitrite reductase large subunit
MRYVIIGNSAAGIGAAEAIRRRDKEGRITLIAHEPHISYSRPLISSLLAGIKEEKQIYYRSQNFYGDMGITPLLGQKVVEVKSQEGEVVLGGGQKIPWDKLLIASGSAPHIPAIPGITLEGVFGLRTLEDAGKIADFSRGAKEAVMIGGGLVGLKAAWALHCRGLRVTVAVTSNRILSQSLDEGAARYMQQRLEEQGINILLQEEVTEVLGKKKVVGVKLKKGAQIPCQIVVVGKGVEPNVKFLESSEVKINRGILANRFLQSSQENIWAAGDAAESLDLIHKTLSLSTIWPNAYQQGRTAGANMAGEKIEYPGGITMNAVEFFGLPFISMGVNRPLGADNEIIVKEYPSRFCYQKLVLRKGKIIGAIFLGEMTLASLVNRLILEEIDVLSFKEWILPKGKIFVDFLRQSKYVA